MDYIDVYGTPLFVSVKEIINKLRMDGDLRASLEETGNDIMINCPFHDDHTPSMGITKRAMKDIDGHTIPAGTVNCFGCPYSSDLLTFISDVKDVSTKKAYQWLLNEFEAGEYEERNIDIDINRNIEMESNHVEYKHELQQYEPYCPYMKERGIDEFHASAFRLKYNPEKESIIFPVINKKGIIRGYQERFINQKDFRSEGDVNSLFGKHLLAGKNELWLTEGPIDAIITYKNDYDVVAIMGGLSEKKKREIERLDYRVLVCAFDEDDTGDSYAEEIAREFSGCLVKRAFFAGDAKDPGDMPYNFEVTTKYMV